MQAYTQNQPIRLTSENSEEVLGRQNKSSSTLYARKAFDLGYIVDIYEHFELVRITSQKGIEKFFYWAQLPLNNQSSSSIANHKYMHNTILNHNGIPVPIGVVIKKNDDVDTVLDFSGIQFPVVIKPESDSLGGHDVYLDVFSKEEAIVLIHKVLQHCKAVLVEEYYANYKEYRVLVLRNEVIGVIYKKPAYVIGDAQSSIRELIDKKNKERSEAKNIRLSPIPINDECKKMLEQQSVSVETILEERKEIQLQRLGNAAVGGEMIDATDEISEYNKELCARVARAVGLEFAGIDLLCLDISEDIHTENGVIIETNSFPGVTCHQYPEKGQSRDVATKILAAIFE